MRTQTNRRQGSTNQEHKAQRQVPTPLTTDIELRPRGTQPVSLGRALAPLIDDYIQDMVDASRELKRLATEAKAAKDRSAEAALQSKIVEQATNILRLFRAEPGVAEAKPIRSQAGPDWDALPGDVNRKFDEAYEYADRRLGHGWYPRVCNGEKVVSDDPEDYKNFEPDWLPTEEV